MSNRTKTVVDENKLKEILNNSTQEEIMEFAYKYLKDKEHKRLRAVKMKERRLQDEKNKCQ